MVKNSQNTEVSMKVMEAIGKGFSIAGRNIGILALLFVFNAIWNIATLPFVNQMQDLANLKISPQLIGLSVVFIFLNIFIQGGLLGALKDAVATGSRATLGNFAKYGGRFYLRFLGLGLIIILILILAALVIGLLISLTVLVKNIVLNIVVVSLSVILAAVGLYYLFLLFFSPYALIADDSGIFKAMGNSIKFVRTHIGRIAGLSTLLVLIGLGIGFLVGILAGVLALIPALKGAAFQVVAGLISSAVNAYITIMISAALIAYYCAKGKKEATASA